ncbi:methylenetetrahydrofolate reductase [NAD(P)H] [Solitalea lacus]|uniref:methylenetetrahydrofolate reductase [NAD(P)H] n=1 Tax=Solitalea lacus TaxID=2911172 RepID=UPI001EDA5F8A|nr:methylenetetrahydrofolate reductase [NAD(P)H] [Solitalea lacus]UKJ07267.1 methylenetetrahydrofolate reductase [NAD(P)H] [Solitalea lacus]
MKITEHIQNAKKPLFSFELLPPMKGQSIDQIFEAIEPLMEFEPPFIDVTYHREDFIYKKQPNGLLEKVSTRKRPGTVSICAAIQFKYKVDAVPHLICGGFTKEDTENALIELKFLGIDNVLVLRGDARKEDGGFIPETGGHSYASELIEQVINLNNGKFLHEEYSGPNGTDFCIGVAGYPEKHFEAPNLKTDLRYLKMKVDMGAEYIVTQMFFDNEKYEKFVTLCRENGINVPIIPGLKPLTTKKQLTLLPKVFSIDIPEELADAVADCKTDKEVREVGIEWCIQQSKGLIDLGAPCLHYYTMGKSDTIRRIGKAVF